MSKIYTANDFFRVTNKMFKAIGWSYNLNTRNESKHKILQDGYYWTSNFLFIFIFVQSITFLYINFGNPEKFFDNTEVFLCIGFEIMMFIKSYLVVYRNRRIFTELIDELDVVIPKIQYLQEQFKIRAHCRRTNHISILCSIVYISLLSSFDVMPIMEKLVGSIFGTYVHWQLPFKFYFPFDATRGYIYPFMYIYLSWLCYKCGVEVLGSDLLFCNITSVVSMRLEILKDEITEINAKNNKEALSKIKSCIKIHQHLVMISEKLEKLYSFSLLADIIASTIITCLAAFNILSGVKAMPLLKFIICLFTALLRVGMQCFHADRLTRASVMLGDGAYNNLWYEGSLEYKKIILFIIMRAQKPIKLTAYKFQALNIESFTAFVRTSYSCFALLQTMYRSNPNA